MSFSSCYDSQTGLSADRSYLKCGLPDFLKESVCAMQAAWERLDWGEEYLRWDCDYCNLQSDINSAEVNQVISTEQDWYLREKYLRMERGGVKNCSQWILRTSAITLNGKKSGILILFPA